MIKFFISKLIDQKDLSEEESIQAMQCIMEGETTPAQIGSFITALRIKGETVDEITGFSRVMRNKAECIHPEVEFCVDTCGTGGDNSGTFNISTVSAFIAAAGGVAVAKHGNRSVSSKSGSADVLEALGANINLTPMQVKKCIETVGIGFMFAPMFHKSMKFAAGPRRELGIRSVFNILGPLTNPAGAKGQVLGVFEERLVGLMAGVLQRLGVERAMVIHGSDGLDEITITDSTLVCEINGQSMKTYRINPEDLGLQTSSPSEIMGGDTIYNAKIAIEILKGQPGAKRDIVLANVGAALYVGGKTETLREGVSLAKRVIDEGMALNKLNHFISFTKLLAEQEATA